MTTNKINYITPIGFDRLVKEHTRLLRIERPQITELVTWAASNGDRSENADYLYGKKKLKEIDRRLRFLTQRIEMAKIVDPISITSTKVQFGATVTIVDENDITRKIHIVGTDEIDSTKGYVSWQSPIANSLLGKTVGEEIVIKAPQGEYTVEIVSIVYCQLS